jgi:hypothetical protein
VKHTACHQANFPVITPEVTNPGNTAGIATGQIQNTIVPPINARKATTSSAASPIRKPSIIFSIVLKFLVYKLLYHKNKANICNFQIKMKIDKMTLHKTLKCQVVSKTILAISLYFIK